jgi:Ankyrin repeat
LDFGHSSALHYAIRNKDAKIAQMLIDHGAIVNLYLLFLTCFKYLFFLTFSSTEADFKLNTQVLDAEWNSFNSVLFSSYDETDPSDDMVLHLFLFVILIVITSLNFSLQMVLVS